MDYIFIILGVLCIFVGIAGSILPGLPGPPLSYAGLLFIHWTSNAQFSFNILFIWAIIVIIVSILDYIIPIWGTKKFGGTKAGINGSTIGLIIGVILLPMLGIIIGPFGILGIIGGPFIGALVGERYAGQDPDKALKAAIGSFIGFLAGTLVKLVVTIVIAVYFFKELFQSIL